jgi:AraC-like DNA-binding protein
MGGALDGRQFPLRRGKLPPIADDDANPVLAGGGVRGTFSLVAGAKYRLVLKSADVPGVLTRVGTVAPGERAGGIFTDYAFGVSSGTSELRDEKGVRGHSGTYTILSNPGELVFSTAADTLQFQNLFVRPEVIERAAAELGLPWPLRFSVRHTDDPALAGAIASFVATMRRASTPLERQEALTATLRLLLTQYTDEERACRDVVAHRAVRRMRDLIWERYSEDLSLEEIAREAGLNKFYALRLFRDRIGIPPHEYQLRVRLAKARELLREGRSGAEVAYELGFCDQSHFVRCFRRVADMTPSEFLGQRSS